ncbi:MAG: DUF2637 domain-containing protein [Umezawaea sp.]
MSTRVESGAHIVITVVVGVIGGAAGFTHTHDWAEKNGQAGWIAWAVAVVVECMVIVAGLELKRRRGAFPLMVLVAAFLLQMAAQVASAPKTPAGWLIAATPALSFLVIVKLLMRRLSDPGPVPVVQAPEVETPAAPVAASAERQYQAPVLQVPVAVVPELESAPVAVPVPAPRPPVDVPATASMTWMAPQVRDQVIDTARDVYSDGRDLVPDDLVGIQGLAPAAVPALVAELNTAVTR